MAADGGAIDVGAVFRGLGGREDVIGHSWRAHPGTFLCQSESDTLVMGMTGCGFLRRFSAVPQRAASMVRSIIGGWVVRFGFRWEKEAFLEPTWDWAEADRLSASSWPIGLNHWLEDEPVVTSEALDHFLFPIPRRVSGIVTRIFL